LSNRKTLDILPRGRVLTVDLRLCDRLVALHLIVGRSDEALVSFERSLGMTELWFTTPINLSSKERLTMFIPRFLQFEGYETRDFQTSMRDQVVYVELAVRNDKPYVCRCCGTELEGVKSRHRLTLRDLPLRGFQTLVKLWRRKGHCAKCKKVRAENIPFLSKESPHFTQDYSWWLGTMCEFAPVSRVAEMVKEGNMTVRRIDLKRMQRMLKHYKIPEVTHIAVDEVYSRKKKKFKDEDRDRRFFTIITDLNTRRVIWVSESRKKAALDQFFTIIGIAACEKIKVVALDQHEGYAASVAEYCKKAAVVWDKFHILKNFEEAVNDVRKSLHGRLENKSPLLKMTRGKYRYTFLKRASNREKEEQRHIDDVVKANDDFAALELIKERMLSFFDATDETSALEVLTEVGHWIGQKQVADLLAGKTESFRALGHWWKNLRAGWTTLKNYFKFPVTSALAEGVNNVIKALKRRSFGFRNMDYFRLKIMQVCGYLNSRYIKFAELLGT